MRGGQCIFLSASNGGKMVTGIHRLNNDTRKIWPRDGIAPVLYLCSKYI